MNNVPKLNAADIDLYKSLAGTSALEHRLSGLLPVIDIADDYFYVDVGKNSIRPRGNVTNAGLDLKNGGWVDEMTNERCFYYDKQTRQETKISPDIAALPEHVVLVKIPPVMVLDPVGVAQEKGLAPTTYLNVFPLVMYRKAEVRPLNETVIFDIAKENKDRIYQAGYHAEKRAGKKNVVKRKPANKKKGGKSL